MKNHYVPKFLQRPWAAPSPPNGDGRIQTFRFDVEGLPTTRRGPSAIGYEDDLTALSQTVIAGMEQHAIKEKFLKYIDNDAANVQEKLDKQGLASLSHEERSSWVRFIMSLRLRQPKMISNLKIGSSAELQKILAAQPEEYEALLGKDDPPTLLEWVEKTYPGLGMLE